MKIGLELEYWVINQKGELTSSKKLAESTEFAEQEFVEPLIEIKTQPHTKIQELRTEVIEKLRKLLNSAEKLNQQIVPLGTPLNSEKINMLPSKRGKIQEIVVGEELEAAKRVAGTHIHFEKKDIKQQLNTLTALDPAQALTNSSPYYQGNRLASSSRNQVYRYQCYKNFPEHGQLWKYTKSVHEWEERMQQSFQKFTQAAIQKDITEKQFKKYFKPENTLWTPVRLRKQFPTIEWRAPDTGRIQDTLRMVEEIKHIVEKPNQQTRPSFNKLQRLSEKSINQGLQNEEVNNYLNDYGFSVEKYNPISHEIEDKKKISLKEAKEIRLRFAQELKTEIKEM